MDLAIIKMAELFLVDYFVMGEAIGIVLTFIVSLYYCDKRDDIYIPSFAYLCTCISFALKKSS